MNRNQKITGLVIQTGAETMPIDVGASAGTWGGPCVQAIEPTDKTHGQFKPAGYVLKNEDSKVFATINSDFVIAVKYDTD